MARGIFFDLDNTLVDRNRALRGLVHELIENEPGASVDEAMRHDSEGGLAALAEFLSRHLPRAPLEAELRRAITHRVEAFPEAQGLLRTLMDRGHLLAIVTNGGRDVQRKKIERGALGEHVHEVFISGDLGLEKPDPAFFRHALQSLELDPVDVLFVGDHPEHDVHGPAQLGMRTAWLAHGRRYPEHLFQPTYVLENLVDLLDLLS